MQKIAQNFFFSMSLLFLASLSWAQSAPKEPVQIRVGIYAPFSNEQAFIGRNILGAMEMAEEQLAGSSIKYSFYTLDNAPESGVTAASLQKFIDRHQLSILVTQNAQSGAMAAPLAVKNNILHFNLAEKSSIADGTHNFVIWNADYQSAAVLDKKTKATFVDAYKTMYRSHPVTEAGYAFDLLQFINQGAVLALKNQSDFSPQNLTKDLPVLAKHTGVMGLVQLDKPGLFYAQSQTGHSRVS